MLFAPLSLACYLAASLHSGSNTWGQGLRLLLASLFFLGFPYNISQGIQWGRKFDALFDGMYAEFPRGGQSGRLRRSTRALKASLLLPVNLKPIC